MTGCGRLLALLSLAALAGCSSGAAEPTERNCSVIPPHIPSTAQNTTLRLQELRELMVPWNISAYIIPGTDAHLSEYIAPSDARLAFMTGFTGSAGTAVVTRDRAVLWTDSRYWLQAEREMDCNWELERDASSQSVAKWLIAVLAEDSLIGFDPFLFSLKVHESYTNTLEFSQRSLKSVPENLVDIVWKDRPLIPSGGVMRLPDKFIQRTWQQKVGEMREVMKYDPYKPTALLLSALDETAWLFNMRGDDIPYNPFFYSYTLLTEDKIWLFLHTERISEELRNYLSASCDGPLCVQLKSYDSFLKEFKVYVNEPGSKVWIGTEYTNYAAYEVLTPDTLVTSSYSPVLIAKAVKDEKEQQILRNAHVRDAIAVIQLLMRLEKTVPEGKETEMTAALYVNECRSKQNDNRGPSFATISASGPNAALAHYFPTNETSRKLTVDEMYLVDSGGQYLDGTTDITRTVHWGTPTARQKEAFTRVLMGNIELSRTIFPTGTRGINMEMLARRALWEVGLNYGHGTGHGVGNYFGVHEWPVGFQGNNIPFSPGMFMSIEPGYYKENDFGIRIEDIVETVPVQTKYGRDFLTFEIISLVPYDKKLIDTSLLSPVQLQWLNKYYKKIQEILSPELDSQGLKEEKTWMMKNTEPFPESGSSAAVSSSSLVLLSLVLVLLQNVV